MTFNIELHPGFRDLAEIEAFEQERSFDARCSVKGIYDVIGHAAARAPQAPALTLVRDDDPLQVAGSMSYQELLHSVTQAANLFAELGGASDEAPVGVAFMLPNLLETQSVLWGAASSGYAVPVNFLLAVDHIVHLVQASGARVLVALGPHPVLDIWQKAVAVAERLPGLRLVAVTPPGTDVGGALNYHQAVAQQARDALSRPAGRGDQAVAYYHTGGTTGAPKLVRHSHRNEIVAAYGAACSLGLSSTDVLGHGLPLFHVAATITCSLAQFMAGSLTVMLSAAGMRNPLVMRHYWKIIERYRITLAGGVPTALGALLSVPVDGDLSSIRMVICGAAAVPEAVASQIEATTGKPLHEVLGMTETGGVIAVNPAGAARVPGATGYRIPYSKLEVRALADGGSAGAPCGPNEIGVLVIEGEHVSEGYRGITDDVAFLRPGAVNSGDLAYQDAAGRVCLVGRAKDLIIRSGHNIDPQAIEDALLSHPAVAAAGAVGQPDRYAGELPVVYVVFKPGQSATVDELRGFAEPRLPERPSWPKQYYLMDALPVTAVGKPYKPDLRLDAARRLVMDLLQAERGLASAEVSCTQAGKQGMLVRVHLAHGDEAAHAQVHRLLEGFLFTVQVEARA